MPTATAHRWRGPKIVPAITGNQHEAVTCKFRNTWHGEKTLQVSIVLVDVYGASRNLERRHDEVKQPMGCRLDSMYVGIQIPWMARH